MTAAHPPISPALLSVNDTALYLGVSRATVYRMSAERGVGRFPAPKLIRGRRLFAVKDLDAFIAQANPAGGHQARVPRLRQVSA